MLQLAIISCVKHKKCNVLLGPTSYAKRRQQYLPWLPIPCVIIIKFIIIVMKNRQKVGVVIRCNNLDTNYSMVWQIHYYGCIITIIGKCITLASAGDICGLNSIASKCDLMRAVNCSCNDGYQMLVDGLICSGKRNSGKRNTCN